MPKLRGKSAPAGPAAPAPSETAFWVLAHWRQSRVPCLGRVEGVLMPAAPVTAPPGRCGRGQQEPRCRNASLQTLSQGLSTLLSPSGAIQWRAGMSKSGSVPRAVPACPLVHEY